MLFSLLRGDVPGSSSRGIYVSWLRPQDAGFNFGVEDRLRERIPDACVFTILDWTDGGYRSFGHLRELVVSCAVLMMVLIGPQWVAATGPPVGLRRRRSRLLDDPYVESLEIQAAVEHDVRVIPVLSGATMPRQPFNPGGLDPVSPATGRRRLSRPAGVSS
jgi:hypothetical protein